MSKQVKPATGTRTKQQSCKHTTPRRIKAAEKTNAALSLAKAARRYAKRIGGNCLPEAIRLVTNEIGASK